MKFREIKNISLEDIYWQIKFGKSKRQLSSLDLLSQLNKFIKEPIFFLSTGRCGTKWFSDLLSQNKSLIVLHSPTPSLATQSKLAYELFSKQQISDIENVLLKELILAGRELYLRYSYKTGKRYIETNNYITFFAPILAELFPDAKFVHLYRHPGEFVRSGIRRNYYTDNNNDIKRIIPLKDHGFMEWANYSRFEKISWLWNETNSFIEGFKETNKNKVFDFNFNDLTVPNVSNLFNFLEIDIKESVISNSLNNKANVQKNGVFPEYNEWDENKKEKLKYLCSDLLKKYNYYI